MTIAIPEDLDAELTAAWDAHQKQRQRFGRRARRWLIRWCRRYLNDRGELGWVKVTVVEDEEHAGLFHAQVTTDLGDDCHEGPEEEATESLWPWAGVIEYGVPDQSWVRVTSTGKVYRPKREKVIADG